MHNLKKMLAWLLIWAMLLSVVPAQFTASAEEADVTLETIQTELTAVPEELAPVETMVPGTPVDEVGQQQTAPAVATSAYVSEAEAGVLMREYMKNHVSDFVIYVHSTEPNAWVVCNTLYDIAVQHTGNPTEGDYLRWLHGAYRRSYKHYQSGANYYYTLTFNFSYYTTLTQEQELDRAVGDLLNQLNVWNKSDYDKIFAVYDYICKNVVYDYDHLYDDDYTLKNTAYAALLHKTAVCQGYASLFYRLLLALGIDNRFISGAAFGGAHGWNIVRLGGKYYNVDTTWDAKNSNGYKGFLKNQVDFGGHYRDDAYDTSEFHMAYPMSHVSYGETLKLPVVDLELDTWYHDHYYCFTVPENGTYTLSAYTFDHDFLMDLTQMCFIYDSNWNQVGAFPAGRSWHLIMEELAAGETYYFAVTGHDAEMPYPWVMMKKGEEYPSTGRVENYTNAYYQISDLVLGSDGIYRTPDGRQVYIAMDNVLDDGLTCLGGTTIWEILYGHVLTYDFYALMDLMDIYGYTILNEYTLRYIQTLPDPGTNIADFLYYDSSEESSQNSLPVRILRYGEMTTVTALPDGEEAWYVYIPEESGFYDISAFSDGYDTYCNLDTQLLVDVAEDDNSRGDRDFRVIAYLKENCEYYFRLSCTDCPPGSTFQILLQKADRESLLTEIFVNSVTDGEVSNNMPQRYYSFTPTVSGNYSLTTRAEGRRLPDNITIYDTQWNVLQEQWSNGSTDYDIGQWMEEGKTYYIVVQNIYEEKDYDWDEEEDDEDSYYSSIYRFYLRYMDETSGIPEFVVNTPYTVEIPVGNTETSGTFTPEVSGTYTWNLSCADVALFWTLYDSQGNVVVKNPGNYWKQSISVEVPLNAGETYSCVIRLLDDVYGNVEVMIVSQDVADLAVPLEINRTEIAVIAQGGDAVWYAFTVGQLGGTHIFTFTSDQELQLDVITYDWQHMNVDVERNGNRYTLRTGLGANLTYYIRISYRDAQTTGSFPVTVSYWAPALTLNAPHTVTIENRSGTQVYAFTPEISGYYALESIGMGPGTRCRFYRDVDFSSESATENGDGNNFRMWSWLDAGETYYYQVGYSGYETGTFDILLTYKGDNDGSNAKKYIYTDLWVGGRLSPYDNRGVAYWFIPEESGYYTMTSRTDVGSTWCDLLCNGEILAQSDGENSSFTLTVWLDAGVEYCYQVYGYSYMSFDFEIMLTYDGTEGGEEPEEPGGGDAPGGEVPDNLYTLTVDQISRLDIPKDEISAFCTFTPGKTCYYNLYTDAFGLETFCRLYNDQWELCREEYFQDGADYPDFIAKLEAGKTYYFEVGYAGTDAGCHDHITVTLIFDSTVTPSGKLENTMKNAYAIDELILGADGIYRTPKGCKVYIAVDNQADGGLSTLGWSTLKSWVDYVGSSYFDLTYWDDLLKRMDGDGYVVLTEQTLAYLVTTVTGNPAWGDTPEQAAKYLFHDLLPDEKTEAQILLGDVNGNGKVDITDAYSVVMYYNETAELTEQQLQTADVTGDGKVDTADACYIVMYCNGRIDAFPKDV